MATSVNKILVPLDNSKNSFRGLSSAIYLAKNCDAKIIALHAVYAPQKVTLILLVNSTKITKNN